MAIFRRANVARVRFFPRSRPRYLPSKTPPGPVPDSGAITITGHAPTVTRGTAPPVYGSREDYIFVHHIQTAEHSLLVSTGPNASAGLIEALIDPGLVRQEAFGSGRTPGLISASYGEAVYVNLGGLFDDLIEEATDGGKVTCRVGPIDGRYPRDFDIDYIAYIDGTPRFTKQTMTLRLRDRSQMFAAKVAALTVTSPPSSPLGTQVKPYVYGTPGYVSPVLYLAFEEGNVWFLQLNTPLNINAVYDGGVQLIAQGQYDTIYDLFYGIAPEPSSYKWYTDASGDPVFSGTWLRLGSKVRVDLRYYAQSSAALISELAIAAGITDADDMAADSVDLEVGSRVIVSQSYNDVLSDVAKATVSIIGMDRDDEFFQRYLVPSTDGDYDTDFEFVTEVNATDWEISAPGGMERRVHEVKVYAGATVQGSLAGIPTLDGAVAEAISRERWLTEFVGSSDWVLEDDASSERMEIDIEANHFAGNPAAMLDYADRILALFGCRQTFYWITSEYNVQTAALQLMDRVSLDGAHARIISIERRLKSRRIRFGLWRHRGAPDDVLLSSVDDANVASGSGFLSRGSAKNIRLPESIVIKCGNPDTAISATGLVQDIPDFPQSMRFVGIAAAVTTTQTSGNVLTVDVTINAVSVFSTRITIDNGQTKSSASTLQPVLSTFEIDVGDNLQVVITQVGDGTAAGLTVTLTGYQ